MRFRLRTLLIVLALAPPLMAALWLYSPVVRATLFAFTIRDALWLVLLAGLALGWWNSQQRFARRLSALSDRHHKLRG
jgi:hypothetical protein